MNQLVAIGRSLILQRGAAAAPLAAGAAALAAKRGFAAANSEQLADFLEQTTGAEREELEAKAKGIENPWLDAPFGTEDNPVVVPSEFGERIVGCVDPDDDSLVWWGVVEDGQPPKQIIEGGEFFVLKRVPATSAHH